VRYLSVCSGIEAATVAWHPLGWEAAAFSEIEAFPRAVLQHHYPDTPCHGDFTTIRGDEYGPVDLLVGGTPCQSFSVAGLRGGIHDDRGNLALEFLRLLDRTRPRWVVWENVPGVFSSLSHNAPDQRPPDIDLDGDDAPEDGQEVVVADEYDADESHAFACFLAGLSELGYGAAYRVFDAQYAGVPQRRRRVFVVGHLGDWRRAAAVLFERHSLQGHSPPRREKGQGTSEVSGDGLAFSGQSLSVGSTSGVSPTLDTGAEHHNRGIHIAHSLRAEGFDASEDGTGRGTPLVPVCFEDRRGRCGDLQSHEGIAGTLHSAKGQSEQQIVAFTAKDHGADASDISPTLRSGSHSGSHANGGVMPAVAFNCVVGGDRTTSMPLDVELTQTLQTQPSTAVMKGSAVRRLTPRECERLQGFPDDYSLVPYRGKPAADGPRYKALGNSMAVPVMSWIGQRIAKVEALCAERLAA
jgi:DNA (cytosine-5)-methyltransferase 1